MTKEYDVIIVGGGPSGLSAASFLCDYGYSVALFDMSEQLGKEAVCSGVISKESFDRYNLPENTVVARLKDADLVSPSGIRIPYSHPNQAVTVVDRQRFDYELGLIATSKGADIHLNSRVRSVIPDTDSVTVEVLNIDELSCYKSKLLFLATGIKYNMHGGIGLKRPTKILKGIQVDVNRVLTKKLSIHWGERYSDGFFGWSIPLDNGKTRVGVMTEGNSDCGLENLLYDLGYKADEDEELNIRKRGITYGSYTRPFSERVLVLGEAAGFIKTTTGGGISYGIMSAEIASDVARNCFDRNKFDISVLSEYNDRCKELFSDEIKYGRYFHSLFSKLGDSLIDDLFHAARTDGLLNFISSNGNYDWHRGTVTQIMRCPNLRRVLLNGFISSGLKLAI